MQEEEMKYSEQFEQFWKLYPGRTNDRGRIIKNDKDGAAVMWVKLTTEQRKLAMTNHPEQGKYTPDGRKWLYRKRWQDEDVGSGDAGKTKLLPIAGRVCGIQGCPMPAGYKN